MLTSAAAITPRDRHLPNYGAIFTYEGTFNFISHTWHHSFHIKFPQIPSQTHVNYTCHVCYFKDCAACSVFNMTHVESNKLRDTMKNDITKLMENAMALIPSLPNLPSGQDDRGKRTLLPIGNILSDLFGVSSVEQVQLLQKHINLLKKNEQKLAKVFSAETQHLSSFESLTNSRLNTAMSSLETVHEQIKNLSFAEADALRAIDVNVHATALLIQQLHAGQQLKDKYKDIEQSIRLLLNGKLPISLVPRHALSKVLTNIQNMLDSTNTAMRITYNNPDYYYKQSNIIFGKHQNDILINLAIPLSSTPTFYAYQIDTYPIFIPKSQHATILTNMPDIFLISSDLTLQTTLSKLDFQSCQQSKLTPCNKQQTFIHGKITCPYALLFDLKTNIKDVCSYHVLTEETHQKLTKAPENHIVMTNVTHVTVACSNAPPQTMKGCTSNCIITQKCKCQYSAGNTVIPPNLISCYNTSDSSDIHYPTNLAILQEFFSDDTHDSINSNSLLPEQLNINIPPIKLYDHSFNSLIASDHVTKHKLEKLADDAKQNKVSYANLAEAMEDNLPILSTDSQWSTLTIPYIALAMSVASLVMNIFLYYKMRTLTVALALIKPTTASPITLPPLIYGSSTSVTTIATITCPFPWTQAIIYTLIITLGALLTSKLFKLLASFMFLNHNNSSTLNLYLTGSGKCLLVPIITLPECPAAYSANNNCNINTLSLQFSGCYPRLRIVWGNVTIMSHITQNSVELPTMITINPILAWKLKHVLNSPYCTHFLLQHDYFLHYLRITQSLYPPTNE